MTSTDQTPEAPASTTGASGPILTITVCGQPAPKGSKRHVGKGIMVESSKAAKPWAEAVKHAALDVIHPWQEWDLLSRACAQCGRAEAIHTPLDGPVTVEATFTVPKPKSAPKRRVTWPTRKPDLDKLVRNSLDPLREAGVYRDDAQVVEVMAAKVYPGEGVEALDVPGAVIRLWQWG